jgi:hypothetical protein
VFHGDRPYGIQHMVLTKNNELEKELNIKIDALINQGVIDSSFVKKISTNDTDKTINVYFLYQKYKVPQVLELYTLYNSKNCVFITLTEIGCFVQNIDVDYEKFEMYKKYINLLIINLYNINIKV